MDDQAREASAWQAQAGWRRGRRLSRARAVEASPAEPRASRGAQRARREGAAFARSLYYSEVGEDGIAYTTAGASAADNGDAAVAARSGAVFGEAGVQRDRDARVKAATESSEEAGGVGRPQGCAARVQVGAQRARMYSPSGGPATGQPHGPVATNADGRAPQPAPANAGQPTRLAYATTAHEIACSVPNTSYQSMSASGSPPHVECAAAQMRPEQMIAHMRAHEYPHFMRHHAQQGMSAQEAHAMYMQYEQYRISSACASVSGRGCAV